MSYPFAPNGERLFEKEDAALLRSFDELVGEYAAVRLEQDNVRRLLADAESELDVTMMRQRLADTSQEMFMTGQRLIATSMVLAGNDIFIGCADLIEKQPAEAV